MEHRELSLEHDKDLIIRILDDFSMRYIILFLYVIRNDLFKDLSDKRLIDSYERVMMLDEVYKGNLLTFWDPEFIEIAIDLGFIRNIRTVREFEQKDEDFIIRFCDPIIIENNTIIVPGDTLFSFISKKFKSLTRRMFNLSITRLKSIRCQSSGTIHPFIFEMKEEDYTLSDELYNILEEYGNVYQALKIEHTIEGFQARAVEIQNKIDEFLGIFDPILISKTTMKQITKALEENKDVIKYLKDQKIKLSEKFETEKVNKNDPLYLKWHETLMNLITHRKEVENINEELEQLKNYYAGKKKKYDYLRFIELVSFNEEDVIDKIKEKLIKLRNQIIPINKYVSSLTKKKVKLLNLDFERLLLMNE